MARKRNDKLINPWLVAVWPGMGHVAASAGSYLIDRLKPEPAGMIPEGEFFSVNHVDVQNGIARTGPLPRSIFFIWRDPARRRDLVLFVGEAQPPADRGYALCHKVVDFAAEHGVKRILTFAAMGTQIHPASEPQVFGAVTVPKLLDELRRAGVAPLQNGKVGGLNGALLGAAAERGIDAACLLGEMPFFAAAVPNPRSSQAVIETFARMTGIDVDTSGLERLADEAEPQLVALYEQFREQASRLAEHGLAVFEGDDDDDSNQPVTPEGKDTRGELDAVSRRRIESLFKAAQRDRERVGDLKRELDQLGVFDEYEDRFLDLFRKAG